MMGIAEMACRKVFTVHTTINVIKTSMKVEEHNCWVNVEDMEEVVGVALSRWQRSLPDTTNSNSLR
jgi:hypothetical protein